jgi:hypothetical protein
MEWSRGGLDSRELGLRLVVEGTLLRLHDLATGRTVPTRSERIQQEKERADLEHQRAEQAKAQREWERQRLDLLERELRLLRAEIERLRRTGE